MCPATPVQVSGTGRIRTQVIQLHGTAQGCFPSSQLQMPFQSQITCRKKAQAPDTVHGQRKTDLFWLLLAEWGSWEGHQLCGSHRKGTQGEVEEPHVHASGQQTPHTCTAAWNFPPKSHVQLPSSWGRISTGPQGWDFPCLASTQRKILLESLKGVTIFK